MVGAEFYPLKTSFVVERDQGNPASQVDGRMYRAGFERGMIVAVRYDLRAAGPQSWENENDE
jgi:hypothetical protein